jgi:hypothetical protein
MVQNWWRNKVITCKSPPPSFLKSSQLNCETNTGHIFTVKHPPESCNPQLSNASKNAENGPELVEK